MATLAATGCAPMHTHGAMKAIGRSSEADGFGSARRNPLSAAAHYATAMSFLRGPSVTRGDLEMAFSGFQTAARLAPDLWEPMAGAALATYQLGNVREAMNFMGQAIERRGEAGSLAVAFALLAFRAGEPELARVAFAQAQREPSGASDLQGQRFLEAAFAGKGWYPSPDLSSAPATLPSGTVALATPIDGGRSVVIEAYLIRETRQASSSQGLNVLDGLSIQFGGTLLNYNYDLSAGGQDSRTGNLAITAPAITYSLNLASSDRSLVTLEASPLVLAREGHKSKFLEGGSVLIVPLANNTQHIERDVGITLEVTPKRIGNSDADIDVVLEMSSISGQSVINAGRGAGMLETDKTHVEVSAKVPFGKAIVVGSANSLARRSGNNHSLMPVAVPGLSRRNHSANRRDVLVVLTVRAPEAGVTELRSASEWSQTLFGKPLSVPATYGRRPSETPPPPINGLLPAQLD